MQQITHIHNYGGGGNAAPANRKPSKGGDMVLLALGVFCLGGAFAVVGQHAESIFLGGLSLAGAMIATACGVWVSVRILRNAFSSQTQTIKYAPAATYMVEDVAFADVTAAQAYDSIRRAQAANSTTNAAPLALPAAGANVSSDLFNTNEQKQCVK